MNQEPLAPVVLVTGGARRVGAEIVRQLHAAGARVALHCRHSVAEAGQLADALNGLRDSVGSPDMYHPTT